MRMPLASGSSVWELSWRIASEATGVRVSIISRYPHPPSPNMSGAGRSDGAAGHRWRGGIGALAAGVLPGEVVLGEHRVLARALHHAQEIGHRRDLLDLLLEEPQHELLGQEVALLARDAGQLADLVGDAALLLERQRDGLDDVAERRARRGDAGDRGLDARVEEVADHHHRVVALLERLGVEEGRQARQRL